MVQITRTRPIDILDLVNTTGRKLEDIMIPGTHDAVLRPNDDNPSGSRHSAEDALALNKLTYLTLVGYKEMLDWAQARHARGAKKTKNSKKSLVTVDLMGHQLVAEDLVITQHKATHNKLTDRTVTANITLTPLVTDVVTKDTGVVIPNTDYGLAVSAIYSSNENARVILREYVRQNGPGTQDAPIGYWFRDSESLQLPLGKTDMDMLLVKRLANLAISGLTTACLPMTDMALHSNNDLTTSIEKTIDTGEVQG